MTSVSSRSGVRPRPPGISAAGASAARVRRPTGAAAYGFGRDACSRRAVRVVAGVIASGSTRQCRIAGLPDASARSSAELGRVIGLAVVPIELAEEGKSFDVRSGDRLEPMVVHLGAFFDPAGERLKA